MLPTAEEFLASVDRSVTRYAEADFGGGLAPADRGPRAAAWYAFAAGGKRLRPALVLATAQALARDIEHPDLVAVAAAFEYIHTYSLVHDDLPVMDNDALRRGRPACHAAFGVETAVQAGAFLLVRAFAALAGTSLARRDEVARTLARASGVHGMVGGQALDILGENRAPDVAELVRIHTLKTGALIRGAMIAGAHAADAAPDALAAIERAGAAAGLAFQIVDDLLDVESTAERMGKPVGGDGSKGKRTYPAVLGVAESRRRAGQLVAEAEAALLELGKRDTILWKLIRFVLRREH